VVVVSFEPPQRLRQFLAQERLPFPILSDPTRAAYRAFGLRRGAPRQVWTLHAARVYLRGLLRGRLPRLPRADIHQLGGDVVLGPDGAIVYLYRSQETADRPPVAELLAAVRRAAGVQ